MAKSSSNSGSVREPETDGLRDEKRDPIGDDSQNAPVNVKTAGKFVPQATPLSDPFAARKSDAPRQAGVTPRPTDKPVGA